MIISVEASTGGEEFGKYLTGFFVFSQVCYTFGGFSAEIKPFLTGGPVVVVCELRGMMEFGVGILILAPLHEVVGVFADETGHEYVIVAKHAFAD